MNLFINSEIFQNSLNDISNLIGFKIDYGKIILLILLLLLLYIY